MIRPCDLCNGSGEMPMVEDVYGDFTEPCSRCAGMPWLECSALGVGRDGCDVLEREDGGEWCYTHAISEKGFRPDPDTVMRWCLEHHQTSLMANRSVHELDDEDCRWSWQPKPDANTALEVVDE